MGKLKDEIQDLIDSSYGRGLDGSKIAKRLIEAGLTMMIAEDEINEGECLVPTQNWDGTFKVHQHLSEDVVRYTDALEVAAFQLDFYHQQHAAKGPAGAIKAAVNAAVRDYFLGVLGYEPSYPLILDNSVVSAESHLPKVAAMYYHAPEGLENAASSPVESDSKARSSDGTLALSVQPCRAEIVAWIMAKCQKARDGDHKHTASVLHALAGEIEQHLEERPVNIALALRDFYADCHARNVKAGWWSDLASGESKKRSVGELFMLMVTELSEAYDAYLTGEPDDKLPLFPGLGVELGDLQIRLADFCGALLSGSIVEDSETRNPGDIMFQEVCKIAQGYESIRKTDAAVGDPETGDFIPAMDVGDMVVAKLNFNANRPDHKIENRKKEDGKRT